MPSHTPSNHRRATDHEGLAAENAELRIRLQELEETLHSIRSGDVDAIVVNDDIYTLETAHATSNRLRQDVLSQMTDAVFAFDAEGHIIYLNAAAELRYGVVSSDVLGRDKREIFLEESSADAVADSQGSDRPAGAHRAQTLVTHRLQDGSVVDVESVVSSLSDASGQSIGSLAVVRDVTERRRADARRSALTQLSDRLRDLDDADDIEFVAAQALGRILRASRVGYGTIEPGGDGLQVNRDWVAPAVETLAGATALRDYGSFIDSLRRNETVIIGDVRNDARTAAAAAALERRSARSFVNVPLLERGHLVAVLYVNDAEVRGWLPDDISFIREVAERTRVASERARGAEALRDSEQRLREVNENLEATVAARTQALMDTEQALRQSQKMEAVGQLTGGIAHDFNNLLAGISASLQVLQTRLRQGKLDNVERYITMGQEAVKRAAALTQRLLAFARRQTLDPKPTDVNRLIAGMEELVRRTVGPSVELEVVRAGGLWATKIDPSQLENALLNLCSNARDAMLPNGGRLTIETANKWLDERAATERELPPGQYVSLCATDTGCGMSAETIKRVFDPFFTTKPLGQGTGLGLSMVYGFVRQSGGQIRIYSEVGKGTTMCLYLPRHFGEAIDDSHVENPNASANGEGETVLVIEDEPTIRFLITEVLEDVGYHVVSAMDGASGLRALKSLRGVRLLVTDVGLPGGMNGRQVADAARVDFPDLKVLFITGYAENAAVGNGLLAPGMEVLTKPFEISLLTRKVHDLTGR
ncbi:hypothetical protein BH11PSE8_BH11PSE8_20540 [soil metagenome]